MGWGREAGILTGENSCKLVWRLRREPLTQLSAPGEEGFTKRGKSRRSRRVHFYYTARNGKSMNKEEAKGPGVGEKGSP